MPYISLADNIDYPAKYKYFAGFRFSWHRPAILI
jgi:hypothetical protein